MIEIYICDDEDAIRQQIQTALERKILAENYDMKVVCSAASAQKLLDAAKDGILTGRWYISQATANWHGAHFNIIWRRLITL